MAKTADVVVENFRSTVKHRLGVDYEAVKKVNPRIVYGSISGFGQDGPYEGRRRRRPDRAGHGRADVDHRAIPASGPVRVGIAINDTSAGLLLANAIVLALLDRERTGEGQWVSTSLIEAQIYMLDFQAARYLIDGEVAGQEGNSHPTGAGTGMFQTADGYINIAAAGDSVWERFCKAADAEELLTNPDFATPAARVEEPHGDPRAHSRNHAAATRTSYWVKAMDKAGVPCGPINTIDKVFADPQVQHLGIARPIDHPKYGPQKVVGQPIHLSRYPQPEKLKHTPELGRAHRGGTQGVRLRQGGDRRAAREARGVVMFDIRLSEEQREFRDLARKFAQEEIKPNAMALDREPDWEKRVPWELLKKGSQLGFRTFVLAGRERRLRHVRSPHVVPRRRGARRRRARHGLLLHADGAARARLVRAAHDAGAAGLLPPEIPERRPLLHDGRHPRARHRRRLRLFHRDARQRSPEDPRSRAARRLVDDQRRQELPDRRLSRQAARRHGADRRTA